MTTTSGKAKMVSLTIPDSLPDCLEHKDDLWQTLDSTKLQTFAACPRQYFLEYVLGWTSERTSNHLVFGAAWHAALEYLYSSANPLGFSLEALKPAYERFIKVYRAQWPESTDDWFGGKTPIAALAALCHYVETYSSDLYTYKIMATEVTDWVPIEPDWGIVVKLDAVAKKVGTDEVVILEHKTGSSGGQFWARQWHLSLQIGAYIAACNHFYNQKATQCIVDGAFFLKTKQTFQRELITKSDAQMQNWAISIMALREAIQREWSVLSDDSPNEDVMKSFPQNPVNCEKYGGCQFWDVCTCIGNPLTYGTQIPAGYTRRWWNPLAEGE